jgi:hypothetical protein
MTDHPITPPPELVRQWLEDSPEDDELGIAGHIATQAARWGADQELEACCEWLETGPYGFSIEATAPSMTKRLRAARRPKPPSLKEQALALLDAAEVSDDSCNSWDFSSIRHALEQLDD